MLYAIHSSVRPWGNVKSVLIDWERLLDFAFGKFILGITTKC